jgi:hypothetical protein
MLNFDFWPLAEGNYSYFQNPNFSPYNDEKYNGTWAFITSREIEHQTAFAGTGGVILKDEPDCTWQFLAPGNIQQNIAHTWEPWEQISSRLGGKYETYKQVGENVTNFSDAIKNWEKGKPVTAQFIDAFQSLQKIKSKVDTPLVYISSEREQLTVEFKLVVEEDVTAIWDIETAVHKLFAFSSATRISESVLTNFELPHAFQIVIGNKPENGSCAIGIEMAALTNVQPTWMEPYNYNGIPMRCDLTLTFLSLKPHYSNTYVDF